ncbi:hypothetical protein sce6214 [Sorangium cellulosum So ce56]|uniref:Uncharacterized protein n=1 Tax=Sorangium cellulosum (strain So ce56) TaxID=448385 RepID=A9GGX8_SORC5|nr:hypothetical protein [Sorangium cellulosum]CAN96381.1 hypothetical protein sce6214 [Sorangium cellulosum So ce56]
MAQAPDLDVLLTALREAALVVGVGERLRLQHLLSLSPSLDRQQLKQLVACVIVRSPAQAEKLERIFQAWFEQEEHELDNEVQIACASGMLDASTQEQATSKATGEGDGHSPILSAREEVVRRLGSLGRPSGSGEEPARRAPVLRRAAPWTMASITLASAIAGAALLEADPSRPIELNHGIAAAVHDLLETSDQMAPPLDDAPEPEAATPPPRVISTAPVVTVSPSVAEPAQRVLVPVMTISPIPRLPDLTRLGIGVLAGATAVGLWLVLRRRSYLPAPDAVPLRPGPSDVPLAPPAVRGPVLLRKDEREAIVWGAERLVSEEARRGLDLCASVRATAGAAGLPVLRFHAREEFRTVWLWIDEATEDPIVGRLASEVQETLAQAGLPAMRATYWAVPDRIFTAEGQVLAAHDVEELQNSAAVAVLTDGRALANRYVATDLRLQTDALLRALSRWPRLGMVDFSEGRYGLDAIAAAHGIPVVSPEHIGQLLRQTGWAFPERTPGNVRLDGDELVWSAACALSLRPVDETTAFALHKALALRVAPRRLSALLREGVAAGGYLDWGPEAQARMLAWLRLEDRRVGASDADPVPGGTLLGRALAFWRERYTAEREARAQSEARAGAPWTGTPAERQMRVEQALLDLWDRPMQAARTLYTLATGDAASAVRARLRRYVTLESADVVGSAPAAIVLPWRLSVQPPEVRVIFQELGLGGELAALRREALRRPGRLGLGIGLAAGLSAGAVAAAVREGLATPSEAPTCERPTEDDQVRCDVVRLDRERFRVTAWRGEHRVQAEVDAGARIVVRIEERK